MMEQAAQLKTDLETQQNDLKNKSFEGSAGGDLVKITLKGTGKVEKIELNPNLLKEEDISLVSDLLIAAFNNAIEHKDSEQKDLMSNLSGGLNIPGLDKLF